MPSTGEIIARAQSEQPATNNHRIHRRAPSLLSTNRYAAQLREISSTPKQMTIIPASRQALIVSP
jgi:hypothetical protein